ASGPGRRRRKRGPGSTGPRWTWASDSPRMVRPGTRRGAAKKGPVGIGPPADPATIATRAGWAAWESSRAASRAGRVGDRDEADRGTRADRIWSHQAQDGELKTSSVPVRNPSPFGAQLRPRLGLTSRFGSPPACLPARADRLRGPRRRYGFGLALPCR